MYSNPPTRVDLFFFRKKKHFHGHIFLIKENLCFEISGGEKSLGSSMGILGVYFNMMISAIHLSTRIVFVIVMLMKVWGSSVLFQIWRSTCFLSLERPSPPTPSTCPNPWRQRLGTAPRGLSAARRLDPHGVHSDRPNREIRSRRGQPPVVGWYYGTTGENP